MSWPTNKELHEEVQRCERALENAKKSLDYFCTLDNMLAVAKRANRTLFRINGKWVLSDCNTITQRSINKCVD